MLKKASVLIFVCIVALAGPGALFAQEHEHHSDRSHRRPLLPRKGSSTPARGQVS